VDGLQLSEQLINDVSDAIIKHDSRAEDPAIAVQYLAVVSGFLVAHLDISHQEKSEFLEHLAHFSRHVFDDVAPPPEDDHPSAFGIWKPGDA